MSTLRSKETSLQLIRLQTLYKDAKQEQMQNLIQDPGVPPIFIFMPSKTQLEQMILKSLKFKHHNEIE
jgi:hypothetical protein